jgi:hypothetical protein
MKRMFDLVQQNRLLGAITSQSLADAKLALREAIPIVADNVAELFYGPKGDYWIMDNLHLQQHEHMIGPEQFPNLAPPFATYFVEYSAISEERRSQTRWTGAHVINLDMTMDPNGWAELGAWCVAYDLYYCMAGSDCIIGPFMRYLLLLDEHGAVVKSEIRLFDTSIPTDADIDWFRIDLGPAFLTTSLMHCKNVITEQGHHPAKRFRPVRRKTPSVRYHTVNIEPMRKILATEGRSEETGLKKALHICRGHFRTYTAEKPLFGRVTGTFFVAQHARGSVHEGVVIQDYRVTTPVPAEVSTAGKANSASAQPPDSAVDVAAS